MGYLFEICRLIWAKIWLHLDFQWSISWPFIPALKIIALWTAFERKIFQCLAQQYYIGTDIRKMYNNQEKNNGNTKATITPKWPWLRGKHQKHIYPKLKVTVPRLPVSMSVFMSVWSCGAAQNSSDNLSSKQTTRLLLFANSGLPVTSALKSCLGMQDVTVYLAY